MHIHRFNLLIPIIILIALSGFFINVSAKSKSSFSNSVYCWYDHGIPAECLEKAISQCQALEITDVYTSFTNFNEQESRISTLKVYGISTYYLTGRPNWYNDVNLIYEKIDKIEQYNNSHPEAMLTGIVLDIEPYTLAEYKADEIKGFSTYADTMESAYSYAKSKNIRFVNVIPYWYDNYMTKDDYSDKEHAIAKIAFDKLFKNADRINVMNYLRRNMSEHIKNEINYARLYNVEIESTADLTKPSDNSTNNDTSFYTETNPINSINASCKEMYQTYLYEKLNFSYHHMQMLLETNYVVNIKKNLYTIINNKEAAYIGTSDITAQTVNLPDIIPYNNGFVKVTSISADAFKNTAITKLKIGKNIKKIEASAFENCKKLKSITITGKKLKHIGKNAFKNINKKALFKLKGSKKEKKIMSKRIRKKKIGYRKTWKIKL